MSLNESIGSRIAQLRKKHHMTQEQLSEALNISIKHCSCVERGLTSLSLERLLDVCSLFDVSLDYLIRGIQSEDAPQLSPSLIRLWKDSDVADQKLFEEYMNMYFKLRQAK